MMEYASKFGWKVLPVLAMLAVTGITAGSDEIEHADTDKPIEPIRVELGRPVEFARDIYPILERNCVSCHNVSVNEGDFVAENVRNILAGGASGPAAVPGKPDESLLFLYAVRIEEPVMPPLPNQVGARALTAREAGLIRQWIVEGAVIGPAARRPAPKWQPVPAHIKSIQAVSLSPWKRFVAWGCANQVCVFDLVSGQTVGRLIDPNLAGVEHDGRLMYPDGAAHRDLVHSLAFSPDGTLLASGGYRVVKLWQRTPRANTLAIPLHKTISKLAVSDDGRWLAAGTEDYQIDVWNLSTRKSVATLSGHTAAVSGLQFADGGDQLYSSSLDGSIRCWKTPDGACVGLLETNSPVNAIALGTETGRLISAHADHHLRVWDVAAGWPPAKTTDQDGNHIPRKPLREFPAHEKGVTSVALLHGNPPRIVSGSEDTTIRIWDMNTGKRLLSISHGGPISDIVIRPDNKAFAACGLDGVVKLWDLTGKQLAEFKGTVRQWRQATRLQTDQVVAAQRSVHARGAIDKVQKEFSALENALKRARDDKSKQEASLKEATTRRQVTADLLKSAQDELETNKSDAGLKKKVSETETKLAKEAAAFEAATAAGEAAQQAEELAQNAVAKGRRRLDTARSRLSSCEQEKKTIDQRLQDALEQQTAPKALRAVAFSADGALLATAGMDQLVQLWDAATGLPVDMFSGHTGPVGALAFLGNQHLVAGAADRGVIVWDLSPSWQLVGRLGTPPDQPLDTGNSPFIGRVLAVAFSGDGKLLATGGGDPSRSGELMLWDVEQRARVRAITDAHSDTVFGVEFSRDMKYLLSGAADKFVRIFDVETGEEVRSLEGHTHHVLDVSWKADGNSLASAGADNVIKYWNADTGEQIRTIGGYSKQITAIQFPGTEDQILSCGGDKTVRFHTAANGKNYRNFSGGTDYMYAAAASNDLAIVAAGGEDGVLRVWNGGDGRLLHSLELPAPRPQTEGD